MANLYDKAGLVNIPVGYQDGFLYNIKPEDNTLGFRFNRDSAATRVNKEGLIEQVGYFGPELVQNGNFSQLGPEIVVNGDFATDSVWTKQTGWSISGGVATLDGTQTSASNLFSSVMSITSGKTYKIVVNVISTSSGLRLYANGVVLDFNLSVGENVFYETVSSSTYQLALLGLSGTTASIDNVSVKQVDPNNYWTLGTGWSIQSSYAESTALNTRSIYQNIGNAVVGKIYKVTYTILETNGGNFKFVYGGVNGVIRNSIGTYTENIVATSSADANIYLDALNVMVGKISNVSVIEVLGDKPRIDYTDSLTSPSFLLEPQRTNSIVYSEALESNSNLRNTGALIETGFSSPDGGNNATRISNFSGKYVALENTGAGHARSIYIKSTNGNSGIIYALDANFITTSKITISGEWQRFELVSQDTWFYIVDGRGADTTLDDILVFGFQQENSATYATSYIPTAGSTVTRTQETCVDAGNASTFNSTEGVLYAEIAALADDGTYRILSLSDGTEDERVYIQYKNTSNSVAAVVKNGGVTQANKSYVLSDETEFAKVAFKFKQNDFALWVNGIEVGTDTSGNVPTGLSRLAFDNAGGINFYGKTKGIYVFNQALTDDELQQLTGPEYNSFAALAAAYNYTVI